MLNIQVHESTDFANVAQLLVCRDDTEIEFSFLESTTFTKYKIVSNYFEEYGIEWKTYVQIVKTELFPSIVRNMNFVLQWKLLPQISLTHIKWSIDGCSMPEFYRQVWKQ
jgi:hypothetical protein